MNAKLTKQKQEREDIKAMRFVMEEAQARWQAVLAADLPYNKSADVLACRWLLIFAPEEYVNMIMAGLPIGQVLEFMRDRGHRLPLEVEPVHAEWYAKIVAYDLKRHYSDRHTPEGREAAPADARKAKNDARKAKKAARLRCAEIQELLQETWTAREIWAAQEIWEGGPRMTHNKMNENFFQQKFSGGWLMLPCGGAAVDTEKRSREKWPPRFQPRSDLASFGNVAVTVPVPVPAA